MDATRIGLIAVAVVLVVDAVLLTGLIGIKAIHRRRMIAHERRRGEYISLLSRHLAVPDHTDPISPRLAADPAFIDAVIGLRNTLSGPEVESLTGIVDRLGVSERQVARLRRRFPLAARLTAAVCLAEIGDESTADVLIEHLGDREPEIRIQCARGLGRIRHTPAIDAILERFAVEAPWVRARFADTLLGFGSKATWPLVAYIRVNMGPGDNDAVIDAIRVLGRIGDRTVGPTLSGILRIANDPEVRIAAIEALGAVGGPLAIRPLKHAFRSVDWRLRAKAATALGEIGDPSVSWVLVEGLEDSNWWVRRNTAAALTALPGGHELLLAALESDDRYARDAAAEALADSGALAGARDRSSKGQATPADRILLDYMRASDQVPA